MVRIFARAAAALTLLVSLAACYVTAGSVIPPEKAQPVPGLEGQWQAADGSQTDVITITAISGTNDYEMVSNSPDAQGEVLLVRGFPLAGDVWVTQMWNEAAPEDGAIITFLSVTGDTISILTTTSDQQALASTAGVTLMEDNVEIQGDAMAILAFLELHRDATFTPPQPMLARVP